MIRIDYDRTFSAARKLSTAASQCDQMTSKMRQIQSSVPSSWQGQAADAFFSELDTWIRENQAIEKELERLSDDIYRVANEFKKAEESLKAQATQSFGGGNGGGGFR